MTLVVRTALALVVGIAFAACGDDDGGSATSTTAPVTATTGSGATTTTAGATTSSTGGTTSGMRGFCDVDAALDELNEELFMFEASRDRTEELVSSARALVDEVTSVAPPEIAEEVATVAAAYSELLDIITGLDYDTSTLDASVFGEVYGDDDVQTAGGVVDDWISGNC